LILGGSNGKKVTKDIFKIDVEKKEMEKLEYKFLKKPYANGLVVNLADKILLLGGTEGDFCI